MAFRTVFAVLGVVLCGSISKAAEPTITVDATSVIVNVPAGYASGAKLILACSGGDRGTQFAAWPTTHEFDTPIPAEGGAYSVSLDDLGFPDGNCKVRAFFKSEFEKLDYLVVDASNDYLDPGIFDTEVYGFELGYTPTGGGKYGKIICALSITGRPGVSFRLERDNGSAKNFNFCAEDAGGNKVVTLTALETGKMNTVVARNNALTVNGTKYPTAYRTAPIGRMGSSIRLNTKDPNTTEDHCIGKWYYLRIYGADDRLLVDYIPVRRKVDGTVGFYDQAEQRFVTPTGGGTYDAGPVVQDAAFAGICASTPTVEVASRKIVLTVAGNVATVTVPAGVATGEKLYLVSDETDRGLDVQAWHRAAVLSEAIPAEGGSFTLTLTDFSIYSANVLRAFTVEGYTRLASLVAKEKEDYLDTGVTDTLCYGFEYGYQPLKGAAKYGKAFAATDATVRFERNDGGNSPKYVFCFFDGEYKPGVKWYFSLKENVCNAIVFRNRTLTHDGSVIGGSGTPASAPIGKTDSMLRLNNKGLVDDDRDCGKWYYIRLFGRSGCKLIDYVPVKRADGTVGFLDWTSRAFITPTGGGSYTTDDTVGQGTVLQILHLTAPIDYENLTVPATAEWIGGASADLTVTANWRCRNVRGDVLEDILPNRNATAVTVNGLFGFNMTNAADVCWRTLKFESGVLAADLDWRASFGAGALEDGFSIDLNGHSLTVSDLQGNGTITGTSAVGGVLQIDVPNGGKVTNAGVLLTGALTLEKTGKGECRVTRQGADYTGGTVIKEGYCSMPSKAHPSGDDASITICSNGVFDVNIGTTGDDYIWNRCTMILDGGTLENLADTVDDSNANLSKVRLTAKSKIYAAKAFGFIGPGYELTELDLNGHTLELDAPNGFYFVNTVIRNGYVDVKRGGSVICYGLKGAVVDASTSSIEFHEAACWDVRNDLLVSNLVIRATNAGDKVSGSAAIKIFGTFTPYTDYIHNYRMQNDSIIDLSNWSTPYPTVNKKKTQYKVAFEDYARVIVDLGDRKLNTGDIVIDWTNDTPANLDTLKFKLKAGQAGRLKKESDGLHYMKALMTIFIR